MTAFITFVPSLMASFIMAVPSLMASFIMAVPSLVVSPWRPPCLTVAYFPTPTDL